MTGNHQDFMDRQFTKDDVGELIGTASRLDQLSEDRRRHLDEGIDYRQLVGIAAELGVSETSLRDALEERYPVAYRVGPGRERRRMRFYRSAAIAGAAALIAMIVDGTDGGGLTFAHYAAGGCSAYIAVRAATLLPRREGE